MDKHTKDALSGAAVALVAFGACLWLLITANQMPPDEIPVARVVMFAIGLATSIVLHLVFVGIAAHRLSRSVVGWVLLATVTFPIGSLVVGALMLWFAESPRDGTASTGT